MASASGLQQRRALTNTSGKSTSPIPVRGPEPVEPSPQASSPNALGSPLALGSPSSWTMARQSLLAVSSIASTITPDSSSGDSSPLFTASSDSSTRTPSPAQAASAGLSPLFSPSAASGSQMRQASAAPALEPKKKEQPQKSKTQLLTVNPDLLLFPENLLISQTPKLAAHLRYKKTTTGDFSLWLTFSDATLLLDFFRLNNVIQKNEHCPNCYLFGKLSLISLQNLLNALQRLDCLEPRAIQIVSQYEKEILGPDFAVISKELEAELARNNKEKISQIYDRLCGGDGTITSPYYIPNVTGDLSTLVTSAKVHRVNKDLARIRTEKGN